MISHAYALLTGSLRVTTCQTVELTEARKLWYREIPTGRLRQLVPLIKTAS